MKISHPFNLFTFTSYRLPSIRQRSTPATVTITGRTKILTVACFTVNFSLIFQGCKFLFATLNFQKNLNSIDADKIHKGQMYQVPDSCYTLCK